MSGLFEAASQSLLGLAHSDLRCHLLLAIPTSVPLSGSDDCKPIAPPQVGRQSIRQSVYTLEPFLECFQIRPGALCPRLLGVSDAVPVPWGKEDGGGRVAAISYSEWNYRDAYSPRRATPSSCLRYCFGSRLQHSDVKKLRPFAS